MLGKIANIAFSSSKYLPRDQAMVEFNIRITIYALKFGGDYGKV
jgi:hypothetical protein